MEAAQQHYPLVNYAALAGEASDARDGKDARDAKDARDQAVRRLVREIADRLEAEPGRVAGLLVVAVGIADDLGATVGAPWMYEDLPGPAFDSAAEWDRWMIDAGTMDCALRMRAVVLTAVAVLSGDVTL